MNKDYGMLKCCISNLSPKAMKHKFTIKPTFKIAGMIAGVVGGCFCGMVVWLSYASQFEGGLAAEVFVKNTGKV